MTFPLDTVLCLLAGIPAGIAIVQGKDGATRAWCGGLLALTLAIGLRHWIAPLDHLLNPTALKSMAIASGVLSIICAVRADSQIYGTLMITGAVLLAVRALGIVA